MNWQCVIPLLLLANICFSQSQVSSVPPKNRFAIIIGVADYAEPGIQRLVGPNNDARSLRDALVIGGFPEDNVILLSSDQPSDFRPTRARILEKLFATILRMPENSLLVVTFSGHGLQINEKRFILPQDAVLSIDDILLQDTAISFGTLDKIISQSKAKQVLFILDASFSSINLKFPNRVELQPGSLLSDFPKTEASCIAAISSFASDSHETMALKQGVLSSEISRAFQGRIAKLKNSVTFSGLISLLKTDILGQVDGHDDDHSKPNFELRCAAPITDFVISDIPVPAKALEGSILIKATAQPTWDSEEPVIKVFKIEDSSDDCTIDQFRTASFCLEDADKLTEVAPPIVRSANCGSKWIGPLPLSKPQCTSVQYQLRGCGDLFHLKCKGRGWFVADVQLKGVRYKRQSLEQHVWPLIQGNGSELRYELQYPTDIPVGAKNISWQYSVSLARVNRGSLEEIQLNEKQPSGKGVSANISGDGRLVIDISGAVERWANGKN